MNSFGLKYRVALARAKETHALTLHRETMTLQKLSVYNAYAKEQRTRAALAWFDVEEAYKEVNRYKKRLLEDPFLEVCDLDPSAHECKMYEV